MDMEHVVRFIENKLTAADGLISTYSTLLYHLCIHPPENIPGHIWQNMACIEESLWKYLQVEDPSIEEYLSMFGLLKLFEYRLLKHCPGLGSNPVLPQIMQLEPVVQRWVPRAAPEFDSTIYLRYRLLITQDKKLTGGDLAVRALTGIADAFTNASSAEFRSLIQALSRKRTDIELPTRWPIPNYVNTDCTDPAWFVWGTLMHLWPKREQRWLMTKFKIYTWNYKGKTTKLCRIGILCCIEQRMASILAAFTPSESELKLTAADIELMERHIDEGATYAEKMMAGPPSQRDTGAGAGASAQDTAVSEQMEKLNRFYMNFIPRKEETQVKREYKYIEE